MKAKNSLLKLTSRIKQIQIKISFSRLLALLSRTREGRSMRSLKFQWLRKIKTRLNEPKKLLKLLKKVKYLSTMMYIVFAVRRLRMESAILAVKVEMIGSTLNELDLTLTLILTQIKEKSKSQVTLLCLYCSSWI